jgi:hypothetical protein
VFQEQGKIAEARTCFEQAIAAAPKQASFHFALAGTARLTQGDPSLARMLALADQISALPDPDKIVLHYALGKALSDAGEPQRAFSHLLAGSALRRAQLTYDEPTTLGLLDRARVVFSATFMRSREGHGVPTAAPIFILGIPGAGLTLVEQILASHQAVRTLAGRDLFPTAAKALGDEAAAPRYPDSVLTWSDERLQAIGYRYLQDIEAQASTTAAVIAPARPSGTPLACFTDKAAANISLVGLIHLVFPQARIIHVCRDPVDTCLSCFGSMGDRIYGYDLGELGRYYRGYQRLMQHWHEVLPPARMLDVRYEDMVTGTEAEVGRILAYCGLEWDTACLRFYETVRPIRTASGVQVRQPIYRTSVGRWRPEPGLLRPLLEGLAQETSEVVA